jgi:hypothetical protein
LVCHATASRAGGLTEGRITTLAAARKEPMNKKLTS